MGEDLVLRIRKFGSNTLQNQVLLFIKTLEIVILEPQVDPDQPLDLLFLLHRLYNQSFTYAFSNLLLQNLFDCFHPATNQILMHTATRILQDTDLAEHERVVFRDMFQMGLFTGGNLRNDKFDRFFSANKYNPLEAKDLVITGQRGFFNLQMFNEAFPTVYQLIKKNAPIPSWNLLGQHQSSNNPDLEQAFLLLVRRLSNSPITAKDIPRLKTLVRNEYNFHELLLLTPKAYVSVLNFTEARNRYNSSYVEKHRNFTTYARYPFMFNENHLSDEMLAFLWNITTQGSVQDFVCPSYIEQAQQENSVAMKNLWTSMDYEVRATPHAAITLSRGPDYLKGASFKGKLYAKFPKNCQRFAEVPPNAQIRFSLQHPRFRQPLMQPSSKEMKIYTIYTSPMSAKDTFPRADISSVWQLIKDQPLAQYFLKLDAIQPLPEIKSRFFEDATETLNEQCDALLKDGLFHELRNTKFSYVLPIFRHFENPTATIKVDVFGNPTVESVTFVHQMWSAAKKNGIPTPERVHSYFDLTTFYPVHPTDPSVLKDLTYDIAATDELWKYASTPTEDVRALHSSEVLPRLTQLEAQLLEQKEQIKHLEMQVEKLVENQANNSNPQSFNSFQASHDEDPPHELHESKPIVLTPSSTPAPTSAPAPQDWQKVFEQRPDPVNTFFTRRLDKILGTFPPFFLKFEIFFGNFQSVHFQSFSAY